MRRPASPPSVPRLSFPFRYRFLCFLLAWAPPLVLLFAGGRAFIGQLDAVLRRSAPLASAEASRALGREVRIGGLSPELSLSRLVSLALRWDSLGTIPIVGEDIAIANNRTLAGSGALATARRVTAFVSLPGLVTGGASSAVSRLLVEDPYLLLVRRANGRLNVQDLVRPRKGPPGKPFQTLVEVRRGRGAFRDFAARLDNQTDPAVNWLSGVNGTVDLRGERRIAFNLFARAWAGTATVSRLGGPIHVQGSAARGTPPAGASGGVAARPSRALISLVAQDAAAAYWVDYLFNVANVRVTMGRADVNLALVFPPAETIVGAGPVRPVPIQYAGTIWLRGGRIVSGRLPAPLENLSGTARLNLSTVQVNASARLWSEPVAVSGLVWDLIPAPGEPATSPQLALTVALPRIPLRRALSDLLPRGQSLPPGLDVAGVGGARASVEGTLARPIVVGRVALPAVRYRKVRAQDVTADVSYANGVVRVANLGGRVVGGTLMGQGALRVAEPAGDSATRLLPAGQRTAAFEARVAGAKLSQLGRSGLLPGAAPALAGQGSVSLVGTWSGGKITAAANVTTQRLRVAGIAVAEARARVRVENNRIFVPALVATSSVGTLRIGGDVTPAGRLNLRFAAGGVDVGRLARAVAPRSTVGSSVRGLRGLVFASGSVGGTLQNPQIAAREVRVLNPGFGTYQADVLSGSLTATRSRITLGGDVVVRRFPAQASVGGSVTGLASGAPHLNLTARLNNLEIAEILRQLRSPGAATAPAVTPPVAGLVGQATVRVTGTPADPQIAGTARLDNLVLGDQLIGEGTLQFSFDGGAVAVTEGVLRSEVGTITAAVRRDARGRLSGTFASDNLNLAPLGSLTGRYGRLAGDLALSGTLGGTMERPRVTARVASSRVRVAGVPLVNFAADLLYETGAAARSAGEGILRVPALSFGQNGTQVRVSDAFWNRTTGQIGADLTVDSGDIATLLGALRRSEFARTDEGRSLLTTLNELPQPLAGSVTISRLGVGGRLTDSGLTDRRVGLDLRGENIQVGRFVADTVEISGSLNGDRVALETFRVVNDQTDTTITASGGADLNGDVNLTVNSSNASLDLVRAFVPNFPVQGKVDVTLRAEGPTRTPTITASVEGQAITVATGHDAQGAERPPLHLSLVRAGGRLQNTPQGGRLTISDSTVVVLDTPMGAQNRPHEVRLGGELPFSYENRAIPPEEPIALQVQVPAQSLNLVAAFVPDLGPDTLDGTLSAELDLGGTWRSPRLTSTSNLRIADGRYTPPRDPQLGRPAINPVSDLDVAVGFEGNTATIREFTLKLGGPSGMRRDFGRVTATGSMTLEKLPDLGAATQSAANGSLGRLDLAVNLDKLYPVAEDLLGSGAAARAEIAGRLFVRGPLESPVVTTRPGALDSNGRPTGTQQPLTVAGAVFQTPTRNIPEGGSGGGYPINPRFDIAVAIDRKAAVSSKLFRVEADGSASIGGSLASPDVRGEFSVLDGFFAFPTARFNIEKGGRVVVAFRPPAEPVVRVADMVAKTTVYPPAGVNPSLEDRATRGGIPASALPSTTGRSTRYRITAEFNGSLLDPEQLNLNATSDPPLTQAQILALLGSQQQIETALSGNVEQGLKSVFTQAVSSSLVPSLLSPLEQSVATALGLEAFAVEYNPNAPLLLSLTKRLPDPFERFFVTYTRTVVGRTDPSEPEPFTLSLEYELRPRLQIGIVTNEQRYLTYFLRGTLFF